MVDLTTYFPQRVHEDMSIKVQKGPFWPKVGEGTFDDLRSDFVNFAGSGKFLFWEFDVRIKVQVRSDSECGINFNGEDMDAEYRVDGNNLVLDIKNGPRPGKITIWEDSGGTTFDADIEGGQVIWIG